MRKEQTKKKEFVGTKNIVAEQNLYWRKLGRIESVL